MFREVNQRSKVTLNRFDLPLLYKCQFCAIFFPSDDRRFSRKDQLRRHYKCHLGDNTEQCPLCSYRAHRKDHLKRHIKHNHMKKELKRQLCHSTAAAMSIIHPYMMTVPLTVPAIQFGTVGSVQTILEETQRNLQKLHEIQQVLQGQGQNANFKYIRLTSNDEGAFNG